MIFSTHCHNDLGLAVANSLAGVRAGARQIECTINGLGERAGNAALEEVVMAHQYAPRCTALLDECRDDADLPAPPSWYRPSSAFPVQYNKAIVGKNAFAHESGIHQDGVLKNAQTYEIMTPESVGLKASALVMGKHSGRHAFRGKLKELGYELGDNAFEDAFQRMKDLADKKKQVFDEDIEALVDQEMASAADRIRVLSLTVIAGTSGPQKATVTLDVDGVQHTAEATGDGPVDATFKAIKCNRPARGAPAALSGARRHRRHRRAGRSERAAGGERQDRHRARLGYRYAGGVGAGVCVGAEQADGEARADEARRGCGELIAGEAFAHQKGGERRQIRAPLFVTNEVA